MRRRNFLFCSTIGGAILGKIISGNAFAQAVGEETGEKMQDSFWLGEFDREAALKWFTEQEYGHAPQGIRSKIRWAAAKSVTNEIVEQEAELVLRGKNGSELVIKPRLFRQKNQNKPQPVAIFIKNRGLELMDFSEDAEFWPMAQIVKRGWITVAFDVKEVMHDVYKNFEEGRGIFNLDSHPDKKSQGGALSAWAYVADLLRASLAEWERVDEKKICVVGHSRGGKAALLAGARYPEFFSAYSSCSGCSGAAQHRTKGGEKIAQITKSFPHWFCENFQEWNGKDRSVEYDQHELLACIAPRHVHIGSATDDAWADPQSEYLSCQLASPIHRLRGGSGLRKEIEHQPKPGEPRLGGSISYHIREGKHDLQASDWEIYLKAVEQLFTD